MSRTLLFILISAIAGIGLYIVAAPGGTATDQPAPDRAQADGPLDAPGRIVSDSLFSPALGVWKRVVLVLPASYADHPDRRYPVAYYLHGITGDEDDWTENGNLDSTAAALSAAGSREMIIVMPDGDDSWYLDWAEAEPYERCAQEHRDDAADDCVRSANYAQYIAVDLVRHVDERYRTVAARPQRAIAGLSMGGYGAIRIALQYPGTFIAAASHSGLLSPLLIEFTDGRPVQATNDAELADVSHAYRRHFERALGADYARWKANDPASLAAEAVQRDAREDLPSLYIDCGTEDILLPQSRALHAELLRLKIPHEYHEYPGSHSWSYWTTHSAQSLRFLANHIQ